jgi:uncharacterized membrane protein YdjX (TVP38/TMEM64 family)
MMRTSRLGLMSTTCSLLMALAAVAWLPDVAVAFVSPTVRKGATTTRGMFAMFPTDLVASGSDIVALSSSTMMSLQPPDFLADFVSNFDVENNLIPTVLSSYALVTFSDMVPFVPCQPLAVALGAKLGFTWAFPITLAGQTTAGVFAFNLGRRAADTELVQGYLESLDEEALEKFREFQSKTSSETQDDRTLLLALIGLRITPFFPFSAGNYLLGGTTSVPLNLFCVATLVGCLLSNFLSTSVGAGGAMLLLTNPVP